jgi:hypothetical protein
MASFWAMSREKVQFLSSVSELSVSNINGGQGWDDSILVGIHPTYGRVTHHINPDDGETGIVRNVGV